MVALFEVCMLSLINYTTKGSYDIRLGYMVCNAAYILDLPALMDTTHYPIFIKHFNMEPDESNVFIFCYKININYFFVINIFVRWVIVI